jgi:hypothetical protein
MNLNPANPANPVEEKEEEEQALVKKALDAYYQQLTPFEQRTCDIARDHLGSSFDLARSNGFIKYRQKKL